MLVKKLITGSLLTVLAFSCGKATQDDEPANAPTGEPKNDEAKPARELKIGESLSDHADPEITANLTGGFTYAFSKKYAWKVAAEDNYGIDSVATAIPTSSAKVEHKGIFLTLLSAKNEMLVTTDSVAHADQAISVFSFPGKLAAGTYTVVATFYAKGACPDVSYSFKIAKGVSPVSFPADPLPPAPPAPAPETRVESFDASLVGTWTSLQTQSGFTVITKMVNAADGTMSQMVSVLGQTQLDEDYQASVDTSVTPHHLLMTITQVRKSPSSSPHAMGDTFRCIYSEMSAGKVKLDCTARNAADYPTDFSSKAAEYNRD